MQKQYTPLLHKNVGENRLVCGGKFLNFRISKSMTTSFEDVPVYSKHFQCWQSRSHNQYFDGDYLTWKTMFFVGITGGIASGKSTVTQMITKKGFPVIDADTIARKVVEPGRRAWRKLKKEFGDEIFYADGTLNREKLGEIIFENVERRKKLNLITHPEIIKEMIISAVKIGLKGHPFVFLDIPLLYETGELVRLMHKIIVVNCPKDIQIKRLMARNNLTEEAARLRISAQMPLEEKCSHADYVVENSSLIEDTETQVTKIVKDLEKSKFHYKIRFYMFSIICLLVFLVCYVFGIGR